jgi:hypothetical protein
VQCVSAAGVNNSAHNVAEVDRIIENCMRASPVRLVTRLEAGEIIPAYASYNSLLLTILRRIRDNFSGRTDV